MKRDKNNDGNLRFQQCLWIVVGGIIGALIAFIASEDWTVAAYVLGGYAVVILITLIAVIWTDVVNPHRTRKNAALRALGKEGIKLVRHDDVAKLAYKGIYSLLEGRLPQAMRS